MKRKPPKFTLDELREKERELISGIVDLIQYRARKILRQKPNLVEFVMGMGSWFFVTKDNTTLSPLSYKVNKQPKWIEPMNEIFDEFCDLKLTGIHMRFTADGEVVTDW
jgi:hypothetical protein